MAHRAIQVRRANGNVNEYLAGRLWRGAKLLEIDSRTVEACQKNITRSLFHLSRIQ